jgi:hypothetical protein
LSPPDNVHIIMMVAGSAGSRPVDRHGQFEMPRRFNACAISASVVLAGVLDLLHDLPHISGKLISRAADQLTVEITLTRLPRRCPAS